MAGPVVCGQKQLLHGKNCQGAQRHTGLRVSQRSSLSQGQSLPVVPARQQHAALPAHCKRRQARSVCKATMTVEKSDPAAVAGNQQSTVRPFKVVIAGGGIGGLVLALGLLKKGIEVQVLERDVTAIRGEGKYRGPIQVTCPSKALLPEFGSLIAVRAGRSKAMHWPHSKLSTWRPQRKFCAGAASQATASTDCVTECPATGERPGHLPGWGVHSRWPACPACTT
jgi:hypothetical protein